MVKKIKKKQKCWNKPGYKPVVSLEIGSDIWLKFSSEFVEAFEYVLKPDVEVVKVRVKVGKDENWEDEYVEEDRAVERNKFNAVVLSIDDLVTMTNNRLRDLDLGKHCVTPRTFLNYKNFYYGTLNGDDISHLPKYGTVDFKKFERMFSAFERALLRNKQELFQNIEKDSKARQRWTWIIERKFEEWNLKEKKEVDLTSKGESLAGVLKDISAFKPSLVDESKGT